LKVDFQGSRVASDGGLSLVRELDERLGFGELIEQQLTDPRGKNTQLPLAESHLPRRLFGAMLQRIAALPSPVGQASRRPEQISATREVGGRKSVGGNGREGGS
jgi:hypothetical protein